MSNPTENPPGSSGVRGVVAQAQELVGVDPGSSDAISVQEKIVGLVDTFRRNNIDGNKPVNPMTGKAPHCGDLHMTVTDKDGIKRAGLAAVFDLNGGVTTSIVAESDRATEAVMRGGIAAGSENSLTIETGSHTVNAGVSYQLCVPLKI